MSEELKPCPFCGGNAESRMYDNEWFVQCIQCFNSTAADHQQEADAVAAWNRRAQPAEAEGADVVAFLMEPDMYEPYVSLRRDSSCQGSIEPLMTVAQHLAALSAVTAERDAANSRLHEVAVACATAEQERDELHTEVEALRKDAERYRWLRDSARMIGEYADSHESNFCVCSADGEEVLWFEQLDNSIDAAMAAKEDAQHAPQGGDA